MQSSLKGRSQDLPDLAFNLHLNLDFNLNLDPVAEPVEAARRSYRL